MSEKSNSEAQPVKKTPLQMIKERQAAQQSNRAAKEKRPDPSGDNAAGGGSDAKSKPMRSSASKMGG